MAKILLVEDDKSLREIYSVRLRAEGYDIVSAGDGEEALAMAIKERPDLIVSDVMMPKISGFDMLDILRSTTETKDVKVIMMTALSSEDQRARGEALGADRYLVKSQVGIEDVVRTVHDVLGDGVAVAAAPVFTSAPAPAPVISAPVEQVQAPVPAPFAPVIATPQTFAAPAPVAAPIEAAPVEQVAQAPVYAEPAPAPVYSAPAPFETPAPVAEPTFAPLPVAPAFDPAPVAPIAPIVEAAPFAPVAPAAVEQQPIYQPFPTPAPFATPAPAPVAAPVPLPQPTAPFSTPAPASLGERVISPLSDYSTPAASVLDLSSQIDQALNGTVSVPPTPPTV